MRHLLFFTAITFLSILSAINLVSCNSEPEAIVQQENKNIPLLSKIHIPLSSISLEKSNNGNGNINGTYNISGVTESNCFYFDIIEPFTLNGFNIQFEDPSIKNIPTSNNNSIEEFTTNINSKASYETINTKTELPKKIEAIFTAEIKTNSTLFFTIRNWQNNMTGIEEINLKNILIKFPKFIILKDGTNILKPNNITLNSSNSFHTYINFQIQSITINEEEISEYIIEENGKKYISFKGSVMFNADALVKYNPSKIKHTNIDIDFSQSISTPTVNKINGIISQDIKINNTIKTNDIPIFAKKIDSSLTSDDVMFEFSFNNTSGLALNTSITLTPWDTISNKAIGSPVSIELSNNKSIHPLRITNYVISNKPQTFKGSDTINIVNENISNFQNMKPNAYQISSNGFSINSKYSNFFTLGERSILLSNYKVNESILFTQVNFNHTALIGDINRALSQHTKECDKIKFTFLTYNTLPMDIETSIVLLDANENPLNDLAIIGLDNNKFIIKPHQPTQQKHSTISFIVECTNNSNQLKLLDKIAFTFKARNNDNQKISLSPHQYILIHNGIASIE